MITTLTGPNDAERTAVLEQLVREHTALYSDMAVERIDGEEASYEHIAEAASSLPFLVKRKLVVLRTPGTARDFAEKFETFMAGVSDTNDVLIVEPKLDKRTAYYKLLKKMTDFREFALLDATGLARWAGSYVAEQGGKLTLTNARLLVERVGTNQLTVQRELDKLLAYAPDVTRESIELLTERTPQSTVFELLEAAFMSGSEQALRLYSEQRALGAEPQQIVAMLAWQLHILALIQTAGGYSADEIARQARLNPFVVRKSQLLTRRVRPARLKELVSLLRELDERCKTQGIIPDEAVQYYLLQLGR